MPSEQKKKVGFVSLGCPKNLVDSEVMMGLAVRGGCELVTRPEEADILVVNTCSFIEPARRESVETILEMAEYKKTGRAQRLVIAGCLVERFRDEIRKEIPEVDAVIGTNEVERILEAFNGSPSATLPVVEPYLYHDLTPRVLSTPRHSAYIKIAEGCDHPCTFCIIPQLRGRFRSRRFESILSEAQRLAQSGVKEITLIGQDTTCYGEDLGLAHGLALLLERLAEVDGIEWVRFLYAYPNKLTRRLLETIAGHARLCRYFDIPLQHASARVLRQMKRGADREVFLRLLEKIRTIVSGATLRTSFIVGFPGETKEDFEALCQFVEAARFDHMGVFAYSDEPTSASHTLTDKVDARTIERRCRHLMAMQKKIVREKNRRRVGERVRALLEGRSSETELLWEARMESQAPEIDGKLYLNDVAPGFQGTLRPGAFVEVEITAAHDYDLVGRVVAVA